MPAALVLAAAAAAAPVPGDPPPRGVRLAEARVTARILPAVVVRQTGGLEGAAEAPRHQLSRRGRVILVEFE